MPVPIQTTIKIDGVTVFVNSGSPFSESGSVSITVDSQGYALYNGNRFYHNGTLILGTDTPDYDDYDTFGDLTGTKWLINDAPTRPDSAISCDINFVSNSNSYTNITIPYNKVLWLEEGISYGETCVYSEQQTDWTDEAYKTIEITGGTDANNSTLIAWLETNAIQIVEPEPSSDNKISFGNLDIKSMSLGSLPIKAMYFGNTKIYTL